MKIGILTFHHSRNYGAVLQAFGLVSVLSQMGHKVDTIDYRNQAITERKSPFSIKEAKKNIIKYLVRLINVWWGYNRRKHHFDCFERQYLHITKREFQPQDILIAEYDCIIVGSDQVWSPIITGGPDLVYWGEYRPSKSLLLSYAASSCDTSFLETREFENVGKWLNNFDAISVREERLKQFVEKHSKQNAEVVIDPTLLAGSDAFDNITSQRLIRDPYILFYRVESNPNAMKIVREVSKVYNARIVVADKLSLSDILFKQNDDIIYKNASVEELLSLIKYAECVVALSFHGTALSLLFEKDFFSITGGNMARVESILNRCGLNNRIISNSDEVFKERIDYNPVNKSLRELREQSLKWLQKNLQINR